MRLGRGRENINRKKWLWIGRSFFDSVGAGCPCPLAFIRQKRCNPCRPFDGVMPYAARTPRGDRGWLGGQRIMSLAAWCLLALPQAVLWIAV